MVEPAKVPGLLLGIAAALVPVALGCEGPSQEIPLREQLRDKNVRILELRRENLALRNKLQQQGQQLKTLLALGESRLEVIPHVATIKLGRYSGGIDTDGKPGDDAVKVYLTPIDQYGSPIKAAGDVTIQLYDLSAEPAHNLLGEYKWSAEEVMEHWAGGFITWHYRFVCPLRSGPPAQRQITVRAIFVEYLTGKTFSAQGVLKVTGSDDHSGHRR